MRPADLLDPYQVNKKSRKKIGQVNNNSKEPHTREPRHPWNKFCGLTPIPGVLPSSGSDGYGFSGCK